ncbi:MAG: hypothetical protein LC647_12175, partial [Beggiatoa sp.]|nr:hypothetical protein [Beggiatoa sp.]
MNKNIHLIPALALGMAVLSIPTLATAATTINVVDETRLEAKGAATFVSVEVTCDFGTESQLFAVVLLTQRIGENTAFGDGDITNATITCDGTPQTFQILVRNYSRFSGGKLFRKGSATAEASAFVCAPLVPCEEAYTTEE